MSLSIYLVSNNKITSDEVSQFLSELNAVDVKNNQKSGQVVQGSANVWLDFLGSSVLDESDDEELALWAESLGGPASSFFELTIGKGEGSMPLAVMIAKSAMMRWNIIVDDLDESIYNSSNIDFFIN